MKDNYFNLVDKDQPTYDDNFQELDQNYTTIQMENCLENEIKNKEFINRQRYK